MSGAPLSGWLAELRAVVGAAHVLTEPDVVAGYERDWTGRYQGRTSAIVRPADRGEVAALLRICSERRLAVVPQGGNTGLVGGSIAFDGAITLSLRRLDRVDEPNDRTATVRVGAGATLAAVHARCAAAGWRFPVDLAARDSATIGGMVATNAGGLHVMRWGAMRARTMGVEAVTIDGSLIDDMRGLMKDNTGYHWPSLLCGSEGTLAVVTGALLSVVPTESHRVVALVAFGSLDEALGTISSVRHSARSLSAIEVVLREPFQLVIDRFSLPKPFAGRTEVVVLFEASADESVIDELAEALSSLDAVVATDEVRARALWAYRERVTEAIATVGAAHKLDVTLPLDRLASFASAVRVLVAHDRPQAAVWLFGHAGDGNLHVNITGVADDDEAIDEAVLGLVAELGGSISAEHGIGRMKRAFLALNRSPAELRLYRAIKAAFDPQGLLNPGVLMPALDERTAP